LCGSERPGVPVQRGFVADTGGRRHRRPTSGRHQGVAAGRRVGRRTRPGARHTRPTLARLLQRHRPTRRLSNEPRPMARRRTHRTAAARRRSVRWCMLAAVSNQSIGLSAAVGRSVTAESGESGADGYTLSWLVAWLGIRVVSVLDSGAVGPGFKSQPRRCRLTVLGKLFTSIAPLFTKQRNW